MGTQFAKVARALEPPEQAALVREPREPPGHDGDEHEVRHAEVVQYASAPMQSLQQASAANQFAHGGCRHVPFCKPT